VLAHGESWERQARALATAGFRVLAIDFRGYGQSGGPGDSDPMSAPLHLDVLAAVHYLQKTGAKSVSVVGGSMGGGAAGDASIASPSGEIDHLVLLDAAPNGPADKLKSSTLFIVARDDPNDDGPRLPRIREQYEKAPKPKELNQVERKQAEAESRDEDYKKEQLRLDRRMMYFTAALVACSLLSALVSGYQAHVASISAAAAKSTADRAARRLAEIQKSGTDTHALAEAVGKQATNMERLATVATRQADTACPMIWRCFSSSACLMAGFFNSPCAWIFACLAP
jgi:pimeloyl-ACP methyl ester carboxylesterase